MTPSRRAGVRGHPTIVLLDSGWQDPRGWFGAATEGELRRSWSSTAKASPRAGSSSSDCRRCGLSTAGLDTEQRRRVHHDLPGDVRTATCRHRNRRRSLVDDTDEQFICGDDSDNEFVSNHFRIQGDAKHWGWCAELDWDTFQHRAGSTGELSEMARPWRRT